MNAVRRAAGPARRGGAVGAGRGGPRCSSPGRRPRSPARPRPGAAARRWRSGWPPSDASPVDEEPSTAERDELRPQASQARQNEMEARLAVRTAEERVRALAGRAESLERAAAVRTCRPGPGRGARPPGRAAPWWPVRSSLGAQAALARIAVSLDAAAEERDAVQQARVHREAELQDLRASAAGARPASSTGSPTPSTATRWPGPSSGMRIEQLETEGRRRLRHRRRDADQRVRPAVAGAAVAGRTRRGGEEGRAAAAAAAVPPADAGEARRPGRA